MENRVLRPSNTEFDFVRMTSRTTRLPRGDSETYFARTVTIRRYCLKDCDEEFRETYDFSKIRFKLFAIHVALIVKRSPAGLEAKISVD